MATIATLTTNLRANIGPFAKGLKKADKKIQRFSKNMLRLTKRVAFLGAALVGGAVAGLIALERRGARAIDELTKFADRIGTSVKALRSLEAAAAFSGVEVNQLRLGLQRMTRRISEAAKGTGEAKAALKELGLDAEAVNKLSIDQQFRQIAEAMSKVPGQADRVRLAMRLFDSEGVALVNTLSLGSAGLNNVTREMSDLGLIFDRASAHQVERANDQFTKLGFILDGVGESLAINVAPFAELATNKIIEFVKASGGIDTIVNKALEKTVQLTESAVNIFNGLRIVALEVAKPFLELAKVAETIRINFAETDAEAIEIVNSIKRIDSAIGDLELSQARIRDGILSNKFADNVRDAITTIKRESRRESIQEIQGKGARRSQISESNTQKRHEETLAVLKQIQAAALQSGAIR